MEVGPIFPTSTRTYSTTYETQRQIADTLSAYDDLIENNTRRIAILEEMAQRLYREWFVHFRYPGHESVPLVESELGAIPEGWEVKSFADLADYVNGYAFKPTDWSKCGTPIVKIAELKNGITESTPRYSGTGIPDKFRVADGDLLFSWSADLNAYLWNGGPALLNQHLFRVDPVSGVSQVWLLHALSHSMHEFRSLSLGTTMRHIKRSALSQVRSVRPTEEHLKAYTHIVQPMQDEITVLSRSQRVLEQLRNALIRNLLER
jgi:type I restriction enzyme S subunit